MFYIACNEYIERYIYFLVIEFVTMITFVQERSIFRRGNHSIYLSLFKLINVSKYCEVKKTMVKKTKKKTMVIPQTLEVVQGAYKMLLCQI